MRMQMLTMMLMRMMMACTVYPGVENCQVPIIFPPHHSLIPLQCHLLLLLLLPHLPSGQEKGETLQWVIPHLLSPWQLQSRARLCFHFLLVGLQRLRLR